MLPAIISFVQYDITLGLGNSIQSCSVVIQSTCSVIIVDMVKWYCSCWNRSLILNIRLRWTRCDINVQSSVFLSIAIDLCHKSGVDSPSSSGVFLFKRRIKMLVTDFVAMLGLGESKRQGTVNSLIYSLQLEHTLQKQLFCF